MIVEVQIPVSPVAEIESEEPLMIVQDAELLYVGGGSHGCLF